MIVLANHGSRRCFEYCFPSRYGHSVETTEIVQRHVTPGTKKNHIDKRTNNVASCILNNQLGNMIITK